ncbi:hypothetical protein ACFW17_21900 [Streptomyces sp. NPDC058961]|uniref:hypothetical protein n=1 Tax=Streptomyces sp. NPDC058961 TaxID=3346680 RepID=UPI00367DDC6D
MSSYFPALPPAADVCVDGDRRAVRAAALRAVVLRQATYAGAVAELAALERNARAVELAARIREKTARVRSTAQRWHREDGAQAAASRHREGQAQYEAVKAQLRREVAARAARTAR